MRPQEQSRAFWRLNFGHYNLRINPTCSKSSFGSMVKISMTCGRKIFISSIYPNKAHHPSFRPSFICKCSQDIIFSCSNNTSIYYIIIKCYSSFLSKQTSLGNMVGSALVIFSAYSWYSLNKHYLFAINGEVQRGGDRRGCCFR